MPKVSKKDTRTPLQEVAPVPMDTNTTASDTTEPSKPQFAPLSAYEQNGKKIEFRRVCNLFSCSVKIYVQQLLRHARLLQVTVPQHRLTPLKNSWMSLYTPVTENMKLDMRMNLKAKKVVCRQPDITQH